MSQSWASVAGRVVMRKLQGRELGEPGALALTGGQAIIGPGGVDAKGTGEGG